MKKILLGVCLIVAFAFIGCASSKMSFVYDPGTPSELMSFLWVPNYVKVISFDDKEVEWTAPPISMAPVKVGVPSGEHTFVIDTLIEGNNIAGVPNVRGKSYTKRFVAGKGYQLINRNGEIQLIDLK